MSLLRRELQKITGKFVECAELLVLPKARSPLRPQILKPLSCCLSCITEGGDRLRPREQHIAANQMCEAKVRVLRE